MDNNLLYFDYCLRIHTMVFLSSMYKNQEHCFRNFLLTLANRQKLVKKVLPFVNCDRTNRFCVKLKTFTATVHSLQFTN
jgi:hypothetical protein